MLSIKIILDRLQCYNLETHIEPSDHTEFTRPALLPRDYSVMQKDLIHICRLSDALRASAVKTGMYFVCVRDRIQDGEETADRLNGMIIVNENIEVENLLNAVYSIFHQIGEWNRTMLEALVREKDLSTMLSLSEPILQNTINISDSAFMLLARTENIETDEPISLQLAEYGYHPESTLKLFREQKRFAQWENSQPFSITNDPKICPYTMVNKVFRFQNTYFIHVVMVCDHHPLTDGLLELFSQLTDYLAIYAERTWNSKNALSHNYDSFLKDLISGNLTEASYIENRAQYLGMRTRDQMVLMKITVSDGAEASLGRIGRELSHLIPTVEVILYDHALLALIHLLTKESSYGIPVEDLNAFLSRHQASAAVSNVFCGLENMAAAYFQASLAEKYNSMQKSREPASYHQFPEPAGPVAFHDHVLYSLLGEAPREKEIWQYSKYYRALYSLWSGDRQHETNNLGFLRIYLENERKATETSQQLHMHRNNVIYRAGRIEQMIGMDLNDYRTRLGLEMSFLLLEIYGFPQMPMNEE